MKTRILRSKTKIFQCLFYFLVVLVPFLGIHIFCSKFPITFYNFFVFYPNVLKFAHRLSYRRKHICIERNWRTSFPFRFMKVQMKKNNVKINDLRNLQLCHHIVKHRILGFSNPSIQLFQ